jgi:hypothetical protein
MFPSGHPSSNNWDVGLDARAVLQACEKGCLKQTALPLNLMLESFDLLKIVHGFFRPDAVLFEFTRWLLA